MSADLKQGSVAAAKLPYKQIDNWSKFSTTRQADGKISYEITSGVNSYGDGPERTVCRVSDVSPADFRIIESSACMLNALLKVEYWLDLPEEDFAGMHELDARSHREHLAAIRAAIAKAGG